MTSMSKILSYILFIGLVVGAGLLAGLTNTPGDWFQSLEKPFFNPPSWLFGPVWTTLYVLIGVADELRQLEYSQRLAHRQPLQLAGAPCHAGLGCRPRPVRRARHALRGARHPASLRPSAHPAVHPDGSGRPAVIDQHSTNIDRRANRERHRTDPVDRRLTRDRTGPPATNP